ncbi:MAG TPA: hypothetical protein VJQ55_05220 [Candidatus Binatia bacterium]|nr:hypothetical protein [Candidatus Binatia bacterium]
MAESAIRDYAERKGFHQQTLDRWLGWAPADRDALAEIAVGLKVSENHLREMMDWLEEIGLRDNTTVSEILTRSTIESSKSDPRLGRADKLKRIKEHLRRWRFPRLAALEESVRLKVQALKLPASIQLSVPPGLEGGRVQVSFSARNLDEFEKLTHRLSDVASSGILSEIFEFLSGQASEHRPSQR